mgnify:CR=1 FL=1
MARGAALSLFIWGFSALGCDAGGELRTQLLVIIDTDLPTVLQAGEREELSADTAVDAVRIDIYREDGSSIDSIVLVAPSPRDWPISFGIPALDGVEAVTVQARVFRADRAQVAIGDEGDQLLPQRALTVDRLVSLSFPETGIRVARFSLTGDCMGVPPSFQVPASTCLSAEQLSAPASEGVEVDGDAGPRPSRVGSWPLAVEQPCSGSPPAGALCIKGGVSTLGEEALTGATDGFVFAYDPAPLRPVLLSPFFADGEEYTVGRLRQALKQDPALLEDGQVVIRDPANDLKALCTYLGPESAENDALPLNCVDHPGARKLCLAEGGDLLSEAQWEHAARGRGQGRPYAWGSSAPDCCHGNFGGCEGRPVIAGSSACAQQGDKTRDGLLDMTGNLTELVLDSHLPYDSPCWSQLGLLKDVVCEDASIETKTWRGGNFKESGEISHLALRRQGGTGSPINSAGFRCGHSDVAR